jgi:hypothetical protein
MIICECGKKLKIKNIHEHINFENIHFEEIEIKM